MNSIMKKQNSLHYIMKSFLSSKTSHKHTIKTKSCWNCHLSNEQKNIVCANSLCSVLQKIDPSKVNYFDLLGLSPTFKINDDQLDKNFRNIQFMAHPDKFATKNNTESEISQEVSSNVNIAYKTLKNPVNRAAYLLNIMFDKPQTQTIQNNDLIMKIFTLREQVENTSNKSELNSLANQIKESIESLYDKFQYGLDNNLEYNSLSMIWSELKYLENIKNEVDSKKQTEL